MGEFSYLYPFFEVLFQFQIGFIIGFLFSTIYFFYFPVLPHMHWLWISLTISLLLNVLPSILPSFPLPFHPPSFFLLLFKNFYLNKCFETDLPIEYLFLEIIGHSLGSMHKDSISTFCSCYFLCSLIYVALDLWLLFLSFSQEIVVK